MKLQKITHKTLRKYHTQKSVSVLDQRKCITSKNVNKTGHGSQTITKETNTIQNVSPICIQQRGSAAVWLAPLLYKSLPKHSKPDISTLSSLSWGQVRIIIQTPPDIATV